MNGLRGWRVVVFMLSNFGGMSGGDKFAFEVFGRFRRLQVWWVGTMAARPGWMAVTLRLRPKGLGFLPYLLVSPFWALLSARRFLSGRTIAFSSSDFVNDVLAGFMAKRIFRCRWVAISHMSLISRSRWLSPWARVNRYSQFLSYALMRSADLVLVVDKVTKEDLKRLGVDEGKICVTRNGIDRVRRAIEGGIKRYDATCSRRRVCNTSPIYGEGCSQKWASLHPWRSSARSPGKW